MSIRGIKVIFSGDPREREEGVIRKTGSRFSGTCASRYSGGMEREPQPPERDEAQDERERRTSNILLLVFFAAVVGRHLAGQRHGRPAPAGRLPCAGAAQLRADRGAVRRTADDG